MARREQGGRRGPAGPAGLRERLTQAVEVPFWGLAALALLVVLLALFLWSAKNRRQTHVRLEGLAPFTELLPSIAGATGGTLTDGNAVTVLQDEAFFDALLADVARARRSVHFETYVWWQGEVCRRLAEALAERARAEVEVRVLLDAVGGGDMDEELRRLMRDAGVRLVFYHPISLAHLGDINNRDHRKLAVVDGRVGYTFGHGVAEEWTAAGKGWRDTAVRVEGPLVASLQSVFVENWMEETGEVPAGEAVFPELGPVGEVRGHVAASSPHGRVSTVELLHKLAIASAREQILIQNPYFLPDEDLQALLEDAARRGVAVSVMIPGAEAADSAVIFHASHTHYERLLAAGVKIFEYRPTLLHQKVLVVDGLWSHVGSTNFDSRSFEINDEVSVGLLDREVAARLTEAFERDRRDSREVTREGWERSVGHRLLDRLAHLAHEQL